MRSARWTAAATALAAALAVSTIWFGASPAKASGDVSWARLMPPDTSAVGGVDVRTFVGSALYRRFDEELTQRGEKPFERMAAEIGVDPTRDIDRIVFATAISSVEAWASGMGSALVYVEGRFPTDRIQQTLHEKGAKQMAHRGLDIFVIDEQNSGKNTPAAIAFLDEQRALLGDYGSVAAAIDRDAAGGPSFVDNVDLLDRASEAAGRGQFWSVSTRSGELIKQLDTEGVAPEHARILAVLAEMAETTATVDLANGIEARFDGVCGSSEDAKTLADLVRGLVALGRLSLKPGQESFLKLLDRVEVSDSAADIRLSLRFDSFELDEVLDSLRKQAGLKSAAD